MYFFSPETAPTTGPNASHSATVSHVTFSSGTTHPCSKVSSCSVKTGGITPNPLKPKTQRSESRTNCHFTCHAEEQSTNKRRDSHFGRPAVSVSIDGTYLVQG